MDDDMAWQLGLLPVWNEQHQEQHHIEERLWSVVATCTTRDLEALVRVSGPEPSLWTEEHPEDLLYFLDMCWRRAVAAGAIATYAPQGDRLRAWAWCMHTGLYSAHDGSGIVAIFTKDPPSTHTHTHTHTHVYAAARGGVCVQGGGHTGVSSALRYGVWGGGAPQQAHEKPWSLLAFLDVPTAVTPDHRERGLPLFPSSIPSPPTDIDVAPFEPSLTLSLSVRASVIDSARALLPTLSMDDLLEMLPSCLRHAYRAARDDPSICVPHLSRNGRTGGLLLPLRLCTHTTHTHHTNGTCSSEEDARISGGTAQSSRSTVACGSSNQLTHEEGGGEGMACGGRDVRPRVASPSPSSSSSSSSSSSTSQPLLPGVQLAASLEVVSNECYRVTALLSLHDARMQARCMGKIDKPWLLDLPSLSTPTTRDTTTDTHTHTHTHTPPRPPLPLTRMPPRITVSLPRTTTRTCTPKRTHPHTHAHTPARSVSAPPSRSSSPSGPIPDALPITTLPLHPHMCAPSTSSTSDGSNGRIRVSVATHVHTLTLQTQRKYVAVDGRPYFPYQRPMQGYLSGSVGGETLRTALVGHHEAHDDVGQRGKGGSGNGGGGGGEDAGEDRCIPPRVQFSARVA